MKSFAHYFGEYPNNYIGLTLSVNVRSWHLSGDVGLDVTHDKSVMFNACLSVLCFSVNVNGEVFWRG